MDGNIFKSVCNGRDARGYNHIIGTTNNFDLIHYSPTETDIFGLGDYLCQMFRDDDDVLRSDEDKTETSSSVIYSILCSPLHGHHI